MQIRRWNLTDAAKQCICLIVVKLKGSWLSPPRWMRLWSSFPSKQIRAGATSLYGETGPHQRPDAKTLAFRKLESKQHLCETQSTPSCLKSCCHYFQLQVLGQRCWKLVKRMISSLYSNLCTCEANGNKFACTHAVSMQQTNKFILYGLSSIWANEIGLKEWKYQQ